MKSKTVAELKRRLVDLSHLSSVLALLEWDKNVNLPPKASDARAASIAGLSTIIHSKFLALDVDGLLTTLKKRLDRGAVRGKDAVIVAETWRTFEREKKLPEKFVHRLAETAAKSYPVWVEARRRNSFKLFLPWLEKIVELKRRQADYLGYNESPYDALLDIYEPGMTAAEAAKILNELKNFLVPFLRKIKSSPKKVNGQRIRGRFPIDKQIAFNEMVVKKLGFDTEAGRIDKTVHPFASGLHPYDVRITTRYAEDDVLYSLGSSIHEAGHGLYEQGLPAQHFGTPLAESVSLGIHESQSRMWENIIGKSEAFWQYFYPLLQKQFAEPFKSLPRAEFYRIINRVTPSLIRTEADEVTYNLHVILRFEIEKGMIDGSLELKNLPEIWNQKVKEYLSIDVPDDSRGVLQDVHWSEGLIGYFPTYSFGNLYSAQFYAAMKVAVPDIKNKIARGQFSDIREWLRTHIHAHGKTFSASALVRKVTGEGLNSKYFCDYLTEKYSRIYKV